VHRRSRNPRTIVALLALALLAALSSTASASALNLTGTWAANYHCEAICTGADYPATDTLTQAEGSNVVTGSNGGETITGTLTGNSFAYESKTGGYSAKGTLTISSDGQSWTGHVSDSNGTSGTYTAKRTSGGGGEEGAKKTKEEEAAKKAKEEEAAKSAKRPTGTSVTCNYEFATFQNTCVASVGDGGPQPPAVTPTGTVSFTTTSGGFGNGASCTLTPTAFSPQVASCTLVYETASSGLPSITATYSGDARHAGSVGHTQYLGGGGPEETTDKEVPPAPGQYPNEVVLETNLPAAATSVEAAIQALNHKLAGEALTLPAIPPGLDAQSATDLSLIGSIVKDISGAVGDITKEAPVLDGDIQKVLGRVGELMQSPSAADKADGQTLQKSTTEMLERLNKALQKQNEAQRETSRNAKGSAVAAASRKSAKARVRIIRSVAFVIMRNVPAGKLKLKLHLNRAAIAKLAGKHNSVTVLLRVTVHLASPLTAAGETRLIVKRITLKRAPLKHKKH
jgi:hypothetical protein